jgi:hypothetical protein
MQELSGQSPDVEAVLGQLQTTNPAQPVAQPQPDQMAQDIAGDEQLPQSMEDAKNQFPMNFSLILCVFVANNLS